MKRRTMFSLTLKALKKQIRATTIHDHGLWIRLPDDIIFYDILARLPVQSLLRFRCVCKSWCCFLMHSNPSFIDLHLSRSQSRHGATKLLLSIHGKEFHFLRQYLVLVDLERGSMVQSLRVPNETGMLAQVVFCGNINGLVCWHQPRLKNTFTYICNPSTRELMKLPKTPLLTNGGDIISSNVSNYFGFDPSSKEFKILNIQVPGRKYGVGFWIFTLGGNSWRRIHPALPSNFSDHEFCLIIRLRQCECLNGALHWLLAERAVIVVFDLREEKFRVIPLPNTIIFPYTLLQVDGRLVVLCLRPLAWKYTTDVWILEDYKNEVWIKDTFSIQNTNVWHWHYGTICVIPTDNIFRIPTALLEDKSSGFDVFLLCYDAKNKSFVMVKVPVLSKRWYRDSSSVISYTESMQHLSLFEHTTN